MPDTAFSLRADHAYHVPLRLPVAQVSELQDLNAALSRDTDAAIWTRTMPQLVQDWLDQLPAENLPAGRVVLTPSKVSDCIADLFAAQGILSSPPVSWIQADAEQMAYAVADLVGTGLIRLRLEPVFDDACSKLHIDNVVARLICTYRGPGTVLGLDCDNAAGLLTVPTGLPVLLKGKQWPGAQMPELRHRSPAILGSGQSRLMLVLEGCTEKDIFPAYDEIYQS